MAPGRRRARRRGTTDRPARGRPGALRLPARADMPAVEVTSRFEPLAVAGVILAWAGPRARYFTGVVGPDNFDYVTVAHSLARGNPVYAHDLFPFHVGRLSLLL